MSEKSSFNPSVGILFVQAGENDSPLRVGCCVSIPRSGFCLFKQNGHKLGRQVTPGFNPSVGILFVQATFQKYA